MPHIWNSFTAASSIVRPSSERITTMAISPLVSRSNAAARSLSCATTFASRVADVSVTHVPLRTRGLGMLASDSAPAVAASSSARYAIDTMRLRRVIAVSLAGAGCRLGRHRSERRTVAVRTDEDARRIERQRRSVRAEGRPHAGPLQVLFDVRHVEDADRRAARLEPCADRAQRLRAREVADDGDDEVPALHRLDEREVVFIRQKRALRP